MNTFGASFRISIFGESHGEFVGITIDGCPPGIPIRIDDFASDIERRKSGRLGTTLRKESDIPQIISGIYNNFSTASPITLVFKNENCKQEDYADIIDIPAS